MFLVWWSDKAWHTEHNGCTPDEVFFWHTERGFALVTIYSRTWALMLWIFRSCNDQKASEVFWPFIPLSITRRVPNCNTFLSVVTLNQIFPYPLPHHPVTKTKNWHESHSSESQKYQSISEPKDRTLLYAILHNRRRLYQHFLFYDFL